MASLNTANLRENLVDVARNVPEPQWDFIVYCRFLSKRLPETVEIEAAEFGRLAGELIVDLREGVDRTTGQTFVPPLVSGRSDLLYDYLRDKLRQVTEKIGGAEFAAQAGAAASTAAAPAITPVAAPTSEPAPIPPAPAPSGAPAPTPAPAPTAAPTPTPATSHPPAG